MVRSGFLGGTAAAEQLVQRLVAQIKLTKIVKLTTYLCDLGAKIMGKRCKLKTLYGGK